MLDTVKEAMRDRKEYCIVDRPCKVYLKPKPKSYVITRLGSGHEMVILQSNHKWVQVSFTDPQDNLTQTGWIQKKYLR
jgi:hypothetical protein